MTKTELSGLVSGTVRQVSNVRCLSGGCVLRTPPTGHPDKPQTKGDNLMGKKPTRNRKPDRLFNPAVTQTELRCDMAVAAFDRKARVMDETWGIDRLPEMVSQETADKYAKALGQMNDAINANDVTLTQHKANVCVRGLDAMDAEARAAGYQPTPAMFFEVVVDGKRCGVLKDGADWQAANKQNPGLRWFTPREVEMALQNYRAGIAALLVKEHFPGAEVIKSETKGKFEDTKEIPF